MLCLLRQFFGEVSLLPILRLFYFRHQLDQHSFELSSFLIGAVLKQALNLSPLEYL